ncbi:hypothetical protein BDF20DRAFT_509750 [Mycotypha africana]|uniref:uncharacterized protein n=1 Tax=Mycotypha africana TaxID=64632 RepID=UPI0023013F93|nr:uncharacterized protein BDF20DRAFT_509750 [Mycotypha africana]KAI8979476.1 hypothetical protein BDF20DRAFT_509750 [Mycotypha africana]
MANEVQCPICGQMIDSTKINAHIDANCPPVHTASATITNTDSESNSQVTATSSKIAPLFRTATSSPVRSTTTVNNSNNDNITTADTTTSTHHGSKSPTRMAPLFAPRNRVQNHKSYQVSMLSDGDSSTTSLKRTSTSASNDQTLAVPLKKKKKLDPTYEAMPLAAKVRPMRLDEFVGQEELLGSEGILRKLIDSDCIPSMVLWGPPGCGKTTIARIISKMSKSRFIELSATSHGAADVKKSFDEARGHLKLTGQKTIIFIDEIHRFTKAQQDLFLPYVEQGTIHLIGATTENPSFKVNSALLSRCKVFVMKRLDQSQIQLILTRAIRKWRKDSPADDDTIAKENENEDATTAPDTDPDNEAITQLAVYSDGDARTALNTLEIALSLLPSRAHPLTIDTVKGAFQKTHLLYDRNGDQHYDIISALHKSIRGSDANAALYWLGRMLEAGEDPLYIARRLVRCASEDIGLADNSALPLAMAAYHACEKIGMPECDTILAHLVVHLAETKKSVRSYKAYKLVKQTIKEKPAYPVPMHIRNAPTRLMKNLGYGEGYKYNPDYAEPVDQKYLPDELQNYKFLQDE